MMFFGIFLDKYTNPKNEEARKEVVETFKKSFSRVSFTALVHKG